MSDQKATNKRLTFGVEEADQALLAAAEAVVAAGGFATFNDLCKTALERFLQRSTAEPAPPAVVVPEYAEQLAQLDQRLMALVTAQTTLQETVRAQIDDAVQRSPMLPSIPDYGVELAALSTAQQGLQHLLVEQQAAMISALQQIDTQTTARLQGLEERLNQTLAAQQPLLPEIEVDEPHSNALDHIAHYLEDF